jgi:hypothetical protein
MAAKCAAGLLAKQQHVVHTPILLALSFLPDRANKAVGKVQVGLNV